MQAFLAEIEHRALRMAQLATSNREDALDIVQDSMIKLVQNYSDYDKTSWKPLFYKILQTKILDWHRRQKVRNCFRHWLHRDEDETEDALEQLPAEKRYFPDVQLEDAQFIEDLEVALKTLPLRQQQVFLLRLWEGLDISQTAHAMGCSESSVKTHYARALEKLRNALKEHQS